MKHILTLSLLAFIALAVPSCSTSVRADGRAGVKHSKHHSSHSDTRVKANVGTSLGL